MVYYFYILYSECLDKFYIGSTGDVLSERIRRHNSAHAGFTGKANDWKLVYKEKFDDKLSALKREKEIKSWKSRKRMILLINSFK